MKLFRVGVLGGVLLVSGGAHAALFGDDEARKAILDLRERLESTQARQEAENAQLRRSLVELQNQIDALRGDLATIRGQQEQQLRDVADVQRRQKDISQGVDERLRKLEPTKVTVDGREFVAEPPEKQQFEAAMAVFRGGDFGAAQTGFEAFLRRYPKSGYGPSALFWLGNAQFATRDYDGAISSFRSMLKQAPDHLRAAEAMLALGNSQIELKDNRAARRTLDELIKTYPKSDAAKAARERLAHLR